MITMAIWSDLNEDDRDNKGAEIQKRKTMFAEAVFFAPRSSIPIFDPHPRCPSSRLQCNRYLSNSVAMQWWGWLITMMMPTMMMPTIMPTIMMLTVMMNTNGNGWWLGLVSLFGVQMYFPSILIIFPKSESAKPSIFLSASCHQMISLSKYNMLSSTADPGSSASNLVSPLPLYRWWWLCWWWTWWWSRVCWSWRWSWRWNYHRHRHQNTKCCAFRKPSTGSCFDDWTSLLRLTSTWPVCDDYERVANDDIKVYVSVFVCGNVFCVFECGFIRKAHFQSKLLCLRSNIKSHRIVPLN